MADTNIRISLELADQAAQKSLSDFISKTASADKSFQKLGETSHGTFSDIALHIGKASGIYDIFVGNLAANIAIKAIEELAEIAHKLFEVFIVEGVKAAEENQNAINSLNVALAASGHYSKEASEEFQKFAEHLQEHSTFSHTAIVANAALIESLAQLDENGLKRATKAAVDMAAALGKDLPSASALVAKAAEGNVTALHKLGIEVQIGRDNAETFSNALIQLESHFGGAAESKLNTYSGAVKSVGNSFEDLIEQVGNLIVKNPAVIDSIREVGTVFAELSKTIEGQNSSFTKLVGEGLSVFLTVSAYVVAGVDVLVRVFQTLYGVVQALSIPFAVLTVPIRALSVGLAQATQEFSDFGASASKHLTALGKGGDGALAELSTDLLRVRDAADKGLDALKHGADGSVEPINKAGGSVKKLSDEMKSAEERAKTFALSLVKSAEDGKGAAQDHSAIAKAQFDKETADLDLALARRQIDIVQYQEHKFQIENDFAIKKNAADEAEFAKERALIDFALEHKKISFQQAAIARKQLNDNETASDIKFQTESAARESKASKARIEADKLLLHEKVQATADTFTALSSLTQTKSKELFEIGKVASIAAASINTYEAITKTMASVPYPFNIPLAIAQGIAGAVQVANIVDTSPSFEQGGIVGGNSFSGDNITANVNSGEMILNRQQQSNLFEIAKNGNSGGVIDYNRLASAVASAMGAQPISVNVGGKTIVDTLRGELRGGRAFA